MKRNLTIRLDEELAAHLRRDATENERTLNGSVKVILRRYFAERVEQDKAENLQQRIAAVSGARP